MDFMLPSYIRAISLCGEVGCTVAVMHPYYKDGDARTTEDGNVRILEELLPYAEKNRVKLAIENIYGQVYGETGEKGPLTLHDCGMSQPDAIIRVLDRVSSPFAGACLDTGHANVFRIHIGNAARALGRRLIALHVNGNSGQDEHAIPFTISSWCEKMDYRDFAHALKEIGYKGTYNLETETGSLPASCVPSYYAFAAQTARALSEPEEE